jgi:hypothetical protein
MCCFSAEVEKVSDTSIFARADGARQLVVYSMAYAASGELAMVLPIPVPAGAPEDAVRFISFEKCPDFFAELRRGFPTHTEDMAAGALLGNLDAEVAVRPLEVHEVGSFDASFVPRPQDFGRLDERFRLPAELWLELGHYRDWGFAVFKLRQTDLAHVHPMAFEFPRRDRARLFFPTLHMHHRRVERAALFDHTLYCQPEPALNFHLQEWEDSPRHAGDFVHCAEALRLLDAAEPCWRAIIEGARENRDTWVGRGETLPRATA